METIYQTVPQKILKIKHWIKTYESRKADLPLKYNGTILRYRTALLNRKIQNWKKQIEYYVSAQKLEEAAKGANMVKREKRLREVYVLAHKYFDSPNVITGGEATRIPKICLCKYILENGLGGEASYNLLGINRHSLYYYRKAYDPKKHGEIYRLFMSSIKYKKINVKRINKK